MDPKQLEQMKKVSPRKAPSQKRSKQKVEQILKASRELLVSDGLQNITTNHIARKANMSVGSLYQYFPNKQAIIFQLSENLYVDLNQRIRTIQFPDTLSTPIEHFEFLIDDQISFWLGDHTEQKFQDEIITALNLYPELQEMEKTHRKVISTSLVDLMKQMDFNADENELRLLSLYMFDLLILVENLVFDDGYPHHEAREWGKRVAMLAARDVIKS